MTLLPGNEDRYHLQLPLFEGLESVASGLEESCMFDHDLIEAVGAVKLAIRQTTVHGNIA